jgi:DNA-binding transcriptional LysR family regulator
MTNTDGRTLDVGRLSLLREIGVRGSIAGAARALGLTASAVSQQLALLERETGASLVDRSPRGVVLTGPGRRLAARAEEVRDILVAAQGDLDRLAGTLGGPVTLAAVASAALTFGSDAVLELASTHPGIEPRIVVSEPTRAIELLVAGDVDLAVVDEYDYVPLAVPDYLVASALHVEPLVAVVPLGWSGPEQLRLADLAGEGWVMPPDDASCGLAVRSACRAAGFEPRIGWTTDDMLILVRAVAAGHGVAVLPRLSVALDAAAVQTRELHEPLLVRRLTVVARASTLARPAVAAVHEALARAAATGLTPAAR